MRFQGRRKIQVSISLHNVVPVRVVWITTLSCRRVEVFETEQKEILPEPFRFFRNISFWLIL